MKGCVTVEVCGTLSDSEDDTRNKENNEPISGKQNKKRKHAKNAFNTKEKNILITIPKIKEWKIDKPVVSAENESTTTEDIEINICNDSDIIDNNPEEEHDYKINYDNK